MYTDTTISWFGWLAECISRGMPYHHYAMNYGRTDDKCDPCKVTREQYEQCNAVFHRKH